MTSRSATACLAGIATLLLAAPPAGRLAAAEAAANTPAAVPVADVASLPAAAPGVAAADPPPLADRPGQDASLTALVPATPGPEAADPASEQASAASTAAGFDLRQFLSGRTLVALLPSAVLFGVITLAPAVLLMTTCFVRMSVVLGLLRQGLGAPQVPSNQVVASLAIFLSALVMWPVWTRAWNEGVQPYQEGRLEAAAAFERGSLPIRRWMAAQIEEAGNRETMLLFLARHPDGPRQAATYDDVPLEALLPAFLVSELETAFALGFRLLLPFLVIDILVATLVVSTGLVMLPPTVVSLPLKLVVFVAADGWTLVVRGLLDGFVTS
jgi:flagellar biosynthetic protein FliP